MTDEDEWSLSSNSSTPSFTFGFELMRAYTHHNKLADIIGVDYNRHSQKFVILDSRGVMTWSSENCYSASAPPTVTTELPFSKFQNKMLIRLIYCAKHQVYFAIQHNFQLQVYNKHFDAIHTTEKSNLRPITHLTFNTTTDELITHGESGTTIWKYQLVVDGKFGQIAPMGNYRLVYQTHYTGLCATWCSFMYLVDQTQQIFFCTKNEVRAFAYNDMSRIFKLLNAHKTAVTSITYCPPEQLLITGGADSQIKIWEMHGNHVSTFRGHSGCVTSLALHANYHDLLLSSSMDGTVKVWSLTLMNLYYSLTLFSSGVQWMGILPTGAVYCASHRQIRVYIFNNFATFWSHFNCKVAEIFLAEDKEKSNQLIAVGHDSSVRIYRPLQKVGRAVCTVLPPPVATQTILCVTYSRRHNLFFVLINGWKIWVYTSRTDPSCRLGEWDVMEIQKMGHQVGHQMAPPVTMKRALLYRASVWSESRNDVCECACVCAVHSPCGFQYHGTHGVCSPVTRHLLVLGLKDGRALFIDQKKKKRRAYFYLTVNKDSVVDIRHDAKGERLFTISCPTQLTLQVWSLPRLEHTFLMKLGSGISTYSLFLDYFACGYDSGKLSLTCLPQDNKDAVATRDVDGFRQFKGVGESSVDTWGSGNDDVVAGHCAKVTSLAHCTYQKIFCSTSEDGVLKVWNLNMELLIDISFDSTLSTCFFLNPGGDLLIGWKGHVFLVDKEIVVTSRHRVANYDDDGEEEIEIVDCDSTIYEDPELRYDVEFGADDEKEITMEKYLAPYADFSQPQLNSTRCQPDNNTTTNDAGLISAPRDDEKTVGPEFTDPYFNHPLAELAVLPRLGSTPRVTPSCSEVESIRQESEIDDLESETYHTAEAELPVCDENGDDRMTSSPVDVVSGNSSPPPLPVTDVNIELSRALQVARAVTKMRGGGGRPTKAATDISQPNSATSSAIAEIVNNTQKWAANHAYRPYSRGAGAVKAREKHRPSSAVVQSTTGAVAVTSRRPLLGNMHALFQSIRRNSQPANFRFNTASCQNRKKLERPKTAIETCRAATDHNSADHMHGVKVPCVYNQNAKSSFQKLQRPSTAGDLPRKKQVNPKFTETQRAISRKGLQRLAASRSSNSIRSKSPKPRPKPRRPQSDPSVESDSETDAESRGKLKPGRRRVRAVSQVDLRYKELEKAVTKENSATDDDYISYFERSSKEKRVQDEKEKETDEAIIKMLNGSKARIYNPHMLQRKNGTSNSDPDEKGDDDDMPDILNFDFHAIYKKDGLQFDERWQERMLQRYHLMKMQREKRHNAAAHKRWILELQRQDKLQNNLKRTAWCQNERPASPTDQAPLVPANSEISPPSIQYPKSPAVVGVCLGGEPPSRDFPSRFVRHERSQGSSISGSRPASGCSTCPASSISKMSHQQAKTTRPASQASINADPTTKYRFSMKSAMEGTAAESASVRPLTAVSSRPSTSSYHHYRTLSTTSTPHTTYSAPAPHSSRKQQGNNPRSSIERLIPDRPRSSSSIPAKIRYVLIKPNSESGLKLRPQTAVASPPSKLEEDLLRQRFPKSYKSYRKLQRQIDSTADFIEHGVNGDRLSGNCPEPSGRGGGSPPPSRNRPRSGGSKRRRDDGSQTPAISVIHRTYSAYEPVAFRV